MPFGQRNTEAKEKLGYEAHSDDTEDSCLSVQKPALECEYMVLGQYPEARTLKVAQHALSDAKR